ncbi:MAG TPA: Glu/Leu/Phe/Val dehydrogenase [Micromonosporaceae bacterium]|jgi:glutamate dehydrogenase/leucine dehydrogenase|nr:Glu/Leu/Phe/Val dehydrogenase [Micromonosporaceae bacterium]
MTTFGHPWLVDDLGPAAVHFVRLPAGAEAFVVVDNVALGPAIGGVRLSTTVTPVEVARLARAMTIKNAVAGLPHGGGKSGIRVGGPLAATDRQRVIRAFAQAISHLVDYIPGPDMGTDETAMAWVQDEIGRAVGLPALLGGIPLDEIGATGYGLAECAQALDAAGRLGLAGARVAVQGFGAVGRHAALQLSRCGALVVAVSDSSGAVYDPAGLDVAAVAEFKRAHPLGEYPDAKPMARDDLLAVECEVLIPAAQPDVLDEGNAERVRAKAVLQGANLPVTAGGEAILAQRGILSVPDVVANAGGVICAAVEYRGGTPTQAFTAISERIRASTTELLDRISTQPDLLPSDAAVAMGRSRLVAAQAYRREF